MAIALSLLFGLLILGLTGLIFSPQLKKPQQDGIFKKYKFRFT